MFCKYLPFLALLYVVEGQPAIPSFVAFGSSNGDIKMPRPLDSISPPITINVRFPFFGKSYDVIRVYSHGLILFGNVTYSLPHQPPGPFPLRNFVCASPYWADTDLTKDATSDIFYREVTDDWTLTQISNMVKNGFPNLSANQMLWAFVATWYRVPGHQEGPGRNTFQAIIATNGIYSFTFFIYHQLEWSAGAWGGYPQVGFNAGDQVNFFTLESSFTADVINAVSESNIGLPGQFIFLTNGNISNVQCNTTEGLQTSPFRGSMHGGYIIRFYGLCFSERSYIVEIDDQPMINCQSGSVSITCTMPVIVEGRRPIRIYTASRQLVGETHFLSVMPETNADFILSNHGALDHLPVLREDRRLALYFVRNSLTMNYLFNVRVYDYAAQYIVANSTFYNLQAKTVDIGFDALNLSSINNITVEFSSIFSLASEPADRVHSLDIVFELVTPEVVAPGAVWNGAKKFIVRPFIIPFVLSTSYCPSWFAVETDVQTRNRTTRAPQCPCRVRTSWDQEQFGFSIDPACSPNKAGVWNCRFHRGARGCYQSRSTTSDVGVRCCYDNAGVLITNRNAGSGSLIAHFPEASRTLSTFRYFFLDVLSHVSCCGLGGEVLPSCSQFVRHRPAGTCVNLIPLPPVGGRGDPHFSTLDENSYTFNGHGEYTLLKSVDREFEIQVRLAATTDPSALTPTRDSATAITAFVIQNGDDSLVQVELIPTLKAIEIRIDGKLVEFELLKNRDEISTSSLIYSDERRLIIRQTDIDTISISYGSNGVQFLVYLRPKLDFLDLVSIMPSSFKENRRFQGLLGGFEGLSYPDQTPAQISYDDERALFSYGESWRTTSVGSIFYYRLQDSHAQHQNGTFRPIFKQDLFMKYANTSRFERAEQACSATGEKDQCIYDILITNDVTMAETHTQFEATVQDVNEYAALVTIDIQQTTIPITSTTDLTELVTDTPLDSTTATKSTAAPGDSTTVTPPKGENAAKKDAPIQVLVFVLALFLLFK